MSSSEKAELARAAGADVIFTTVMGNDAFKDFALADLEAAGVKLNQNVESQIDVLMKGVEANEGLIAGIIVERV